LSEHIRIMVEMYRIKSVQVRLLKLTQSCVLQYTEITPFQ
jgi:hypothetical protein